MRLSDSEIKRRLRALPESVPPTNLELVAQGMIPRELEDLLRAGWIIMNPLPENHEAFGPCSIDLRFGSWIETRLNAFEITEIEGRRVIRLSTYDERGGKKIALANDRLVEYTQEGSHIKFYLKSNEIFELPPNLLITAPTLECLYVPTDLVAWLEGRSRFARRGVTVHFSSNRFDPGWCGVMVMEIHNLSAAAVNLYPGLPIAAATFEQVGPLPVETPYFAKKTARFRGQR